MPAYAIIKLTAEECRITKEKYNLESFSIFSRSTIKNVMRVLVREVALRSAEHTRPMEIREKLNETTEIKVFTQKKAGDRTVVITDGAYSAPIAQQLLHRASENENYEQLLQEYKNWEDKDTLKKIEDELEKCNMIVVDGLSKILERGESLSDLVEKSETLSSQTKLLFKTAKKKNRCC